MFGLLIAINALTARSVTAAETAEQKCSDFTTNNRPCTAMEEFGYCLTNAIDSFNGCWDGAVWYVKAGCVLAYDVDYYACAAGLPIDVVKG